MAETYLAERRVEGAQGADFGRSVCLKLILPEHNEDPEFLAWFFEEARIHGKLHHDNIVQVYDFGAHQGLHYLVLEYVEGCELRRLLRVLSDHRRRLPHALSVVIAYELASALAVAHELTIDNVHQNLVHRDLSPHNVLLSLHGHAKLCDFGVVKAKSRAVRTETGTTKGKVPYMSPEQIVAPSGIDGRTDLFALGVIMFELLSGQHPFRRAGDESDAELLRRIVSGDRPRVDALVNDVPPPLVEIVESLLQTDRKRRMPSAVALARKLEAIPHTLSAASVRDLAAYVRAARVGKLPPEDELMSSTLPVSQLPTQTRAADEAMPSPASVSLNPPKRRGLPLWLIGLSATFALAFVVTFALRSGQKVAPRSPPNESALGTDAGASSHAPRPAASERPSEAADAAVAAARPGRAPEPVSEPEDEPSRSAESVAPVSMAEETSPAHAEAPKHVHAARAARRQSAEAGVGAHEASVLDASVTSPKATTQPTVAAGDSSGVTKPPAAETPADAAIKERTAWLDIVVVPAEGKVYRVWVDGQYQGTADVKVKVSPGKHVVAVGIDAPTIERGVRASANRARQLLFRP